MNNPVQLLFSERCQSWNNEVAVAREFSLAFSQIAINNKLKPGTGTCVVCMNYA